jgi:hypothetical protein
VDTDAEIAWCIGRSDADSPGPVQLCLVGAGDASTSAGDQSMMPLSVTILERAAGAWSALPIEEFGRSAPE